MRRLAGWLVLTFGSMILTGCFSAVRITRGPAVPVNSPSRNKNTSVPGIPFYAKKGVCKRQSVWLQPVMILTFEATEISGGNRKLGPWTKELSLSEFKQTPQIEQLRQELSQSGAVEAGNFPKIQGQWAAIVQKPSYVPLPVDEAKLVDSADAILISNTAEVDTTVDYAHIYYYNAQRPWVGSAQVDAKLNTDGTLSEGTAQVQSSTLSSFLNLVPSQQLASLIPPLTRAAAGPPAGTYRVKLTIREEDYLHTHTQYSNAVDNCAPLPNGVVQNYALQIKRGSENTSKSKQGENGATSGKGTKPSTAK